MSDRLHKTEITGESLLARLNRLDPYWGPQLVILAARDSRDVKALVGPAGNAALHRTNCSVLIADRRHL